MNREEHLKWCKDRAMHYVNTGEYAEAVTSMLSDLSKNPETESSSGGIFASMGMMELMGHPSRASITRFIQGFN